MKLTLIAAGLHREIQPYIALGKALSQADYTLQMVTWTNHEALVRQHDLDFSALTADGDHTALRDTDAILSQLESGFGYDLAAERTIPFIGLTTTPQKVDSLARFLGRFATGRDPMHRIMQNRTPVIQGFSPHVIPPARNQADHIHTTGFWFRDEPEWQPASDLLDFLDSDPPPVYIDLGESEAKTNTLLILAALTKIPGLRAIIANGWDELNPAELSEDVFITPPLPQQWLFPRLSTVVHQGDTTTTAAGLRAGIPQVVVPTTPTQRFWARRLKKLGVGTRPIPRPKLDVENLAKVIVQTLLDDPMGQRALVLGEQIQAEDGIGNAVRVIEQIIIGR